MAPAPGDLPRDEARRWAVVLVVPLVAFVVGIIALPRPVAVGGARPADGAAELAGVVSKTAPQPRAKVDAVLGNAIRVLGADLPVTAVARGDRLTLRCYFESLAGLDEDWQIFLHIDAKQGGYRMHGDHFPAHGRYSTTLWQKGDFIADDWADAVPRDAPSGSYEVWLGFYIGDNRLPFTGGDDAAHDGVDRVRVGTIQVQ